MPLKLTCPHCGQPTRLTEPLPLPGAEVQCSSCGQGLAVTWPPGVMDSLRAKGKKFQTEAQAEDAVRRKAASTEGRGEPLPGRPAPKAPPPPPARRASDRTEAPTVGGMPTTVDKTQVDEGRVADASYAGIDRTVPSARTPYGALPGNADEPESVRKLGVPEWEDDDPGVFQDRAGRAGAGADADDATEADRGPAAEPMKPAKDGKAAKDGKEPKDAKARKAEAAAAKTVATKAAAKAAKKKAAPVRRGCMGMLGAFGTLGVVGAGVLLLAGVLGAGGGYWYFSQDLPSIEALQAYEPPTVTVVYDKDGQVLGEIYDERRYVVPLEQIPKQVQNAFVAAEDANFWTHNGIDYMGIVRAIGRDAISGEKKQGASTITQQVARNFLLTREKTVTRKIKEVLLSWRIDDAYTKEHILYLYLNEIYLGSHAYGVEAASRVYFGKHVQDLDLAEAAMIAGLPPAPSAYSPHKDFDAAKRRQGYVLDQMVKNGYVTQAEADAAAKEDVQIVAGENEFLTKAPHFTEYVRRYLVDKYGEDKVLHEGLQVTTTCDLALQTVANEAVVHNVDDIDERMGFRRTGLVHLASDADIEKQRAKEEADMTAAWAEEQDPAGRVAAPKVSVLEPDHKYEAVILEVDHKWAKVGIGSHVGVVPAAWSDWVYNPDPRRSWKNRVPDFLEPGDQDGDGKKEPVLQKGDVVTVHVRDLSTTSPKDDATKKAFAKTPGEKEDDVAVELWQDPEVEAAMMSFDLDTGAVRAMVGGADFAESQFNRAIQAERQVGSTFKPIVYGAAIDTKKITTATMVADAPIAMPTDNDFIWKPEDYAHDYMGNITLRKALALSKNTCTVRVLDTIDPGMNNDVVYKFARSLGIGGPPTYTLPADWIAHPDNDHLCPWVREKPTSTICMDRDPPKPDGMTNTQFRAQMKPDDVYMCRACDYSMALGSASLTMEELMRAYSAFGTGGKLVQPYYIEEVRDRKGEVLEKHEATPPVQVIDPGVASVVNWLLQGVVQEGTAAAVNALGIHAAGKTGTTNDEKDAWFVGLTPDVITAVWVGFDQPKTLGVSSTGGHTALPIWMDYMKVAAPKAKDRPFQVTGDVEWALIDESTGRRVTSGGRAYPFLHGTAPENTGVEAGQATITDLSTE